MFKIILKCFDYEIMVMIIKIRENNDDNGNIIIYIKLLMNYIINELFFILYTFSVENSF